MPTLNSYWLFCWLNWSFFSGTVFVHTSSDDPQSVVQLLRHRYCSDPNVYRGFYRLSDEDKINVYFIRETKPQKEYGRRNRVKPDVMDHHFYMVWLNTISHGITWFSEYSLGNSIELIIPRKGMVYIHTIKKNSSI